jgi:hypothetical protein
MKCYKDQLKKCNIKTQYAAADSSTWWKRCTEVGGEKHQKQLRRDTTMPAPANTCHT